MSDNLARKERFVGYLEPSKWEHSYVLASFVGLMTLANFTFLIYPYSKLEATPPVHLAIKANEIWQDDVIYFADFTCDNWIFKYFNKRTSWRPLTLKDLEALRDELLYLKSQGKKTWIDITVLDQLNEAQELASWLAEGFDLTATHGLIDRKHRIQFSLVVPKLPIERNSVIPKRSVGVSPSQVRADNLAIRSFVRYIR